MMKTYGRIAGDCLKVRKLDTPRARTLSILVTKYAESGRKLTARMLKENKLILGVGVAGAAIESAMEGIGKVFVDHLPSFVWTLLILIVAILVFWIILPSKEKKSDNSSKSKFTIIFEEVQKVFTTETPTINSSEALELRKSVLQLLTDIKDKINVFKRIKENIQGHEGNKNKSQKEIDAMVQYHRDDLLMVYWGEQKGKAIQLRNKIKLLPKVEIKSLSENFYMSPQTIEDLEKILDDLDKLVLEMNYHY